MISLLISSSSIKLDMRDLLTSTLLNKGDEYRLDLQDPLVFMSSQMRIERKHSLGGPLHKS